MWIIKTAMKFCENCNNMLYVRHSEDDQELINFCKNCNWTIVAKEQEQFKNSLLDTAHTATNLKLSQYLTKNIKYDLTLPRVNNIVCPNIECTRKPNEENKVIYAKYDIENMNFVYYCCHCEKFWVSDKKLMTN